MESLEMESYKAQGRKIYVIQLTAGESLYARACEWNPIGNRYKIFQICIFSARYYRAFTAQCAKTLEFTCDTALAYSAPLVPPRTFRVNPPQTFDITPPVKTMADLTALPNDLLDIIIADLPTKNLARLRQTSKAFQSYCFPYLAKRLHNNIICHFRTGGQELNITNNTGAFRAPTSDGYSHQPCASVDIGLLLLVSRNPCMRDKYTRLDITGADISELSKDLQRLQLPNLKRLQLFAVEFASVNDLAALVKAHTGTLNHLALKQLRIRSSVLPLKLEWTQLLRYLHTDVALRNLVVDMPWYGTSRKSNAMFSGLVWVISEPGMYQERELCWLQPGWAEAEDRCWAVRSDQWFDSRHDGLVRYDIVFGTLSARGEAAVFAGLEEYIGRMRDRAATKRPRQSAVRRLCSWLEKLGRKRGGRQQEQTAYAKMLED